MKNLVEQSEIDALCEELRKELTLYNTTGYSQENEAAWGFLKDRIIELAANLLCSCRG